MSLRLTYEDTPAGFIMSSTNEAEEEKGKVFLYGVLPESNSQLVGNPLVAYSTTEGYQLESRDINQLGPDLALGPEAVVINPAVIPFDQLLLFFSLVAPNYPKTLFLFNSPNPSEAQKAFWRNFGVFTILPTPLTPLDLFSLIKVFRKIAGKVSPTVDFSLSVDFADRLASAGQFVDFTLTIKPTLGSNFKVSLGFTGSEIGNQITFFPQESLVPFTSTCHAFIPVSLLGKRASFFVESRAGDLVRVVKLTVTVVP